MTAAGGKKHFVVLDGMRGVAAIAVAAFHAPQLLANENPLGTTPALAVDFFFCLSGFVVAYAYGARLASGMSFGEFAMRRAVRLYPMIALGTAFGALVLLAGALHRGGLGVEAVAGAAGGFLLLPAGLAFGLQAFPANNPVWSLFFECAANAVYAAAPPSRVAPLVATLLASAAALALASFACGGLYGIGFEGWTGFALGIVRVTYPFLAGVLIFRLSLHEGPAAVPGWAAVAALAAALSLAAQPIWLHQAALSLVVFPAIVVAGARARLGALRPILSWLGDISYPLYLIHQPVLRLAKNSPAIAALGRHHPVATTLICVGACCLVSTLLFHAYDEPLRRWAATALRRRRTMPAAALPAA